MAYIANTRSPNRFDIRLSSSIPERYREQDQVSSQYPTNEIRLPFQSLSDDQASKIVRHDYENAANYRYMNHDWRWVIADTLFTGWKPTRYWEGTKIPMSSLAIMVAFDQIESFVPRVIEELFEDPEWFGADPLKGTNPAAARQIRDILLAQLHDSVPEWQIRQVVKSAAMYGNGVLMAGWEYSVNKTLQYIPEFKPVTKRIIHPVTGAAMDMPTGQYSREVKERQIEEEVNHPIIQYVPLRFCFPDPNAPSPVINDSRFFIHVSYMDVDELDALRKTDGFESMPDKYTLLQMAHQKPNDQMDQTMAEMEAARRSSWTPAIDQSTDPAAARCKVTHYYTKERMLWQINSRYLCYNKPNPIGKITYYNTFYADLLDRWYAMGICDVIESEQRVQEGFVNGTLNEWALALHPTTVRNRGSSTPVYQLRVRPGGVSDSNDPKNDVIRQYPMGISNGSNMQVQASDLRAQKRTGITDAAMLGISSGNNPAMRTAAGATMQGQASHGRVRGFIGLVELLVIAPMLEDVFAYNQRFLDPDQMIESLKGTQIDPSVIWGAKVKFDLRASTRMQAKQALIQMMPTTVQMLMNPGLQQELRSQGKTINYTDIFNTWMDATGYHRKFEWIRQMTPQEAQMYQQSMMMRPDMVKSQMQDRRMQALKDIGLSREEMITFREMLKKMMDERGQELGGGLDPSTLLSAFQGPDQGLQQ